MPSIVFWEYVGGGTAHYRCRTPGGALVRLGWDVDYVDGFDSVLDADVVVFQRTIADWIPDTMRALKAARPNTVIVYDIDDWFDDIPDYNPASKYVANPATSLAYCHEAMRIADLITVSTPGLADLYGRFGPTVVLPNLLDPYVWSDNDRYVAPHDGIHIGWLAAYKWRGGDIEVLRPWLPRFLDEHPDVTFCALGCPELLDDLGIDGFSCDMAPYTHLPKMLGTLDVSLVPLAFNAFNWRGKSACKSMESNAMGVPTVASPSEANRAYVQPGVNGLLVRKNNWAQQIEKVIANLDAYRDGARQVAKGYMIDDHIWRWEAAYRLGADLRPRRHLSASVR